MAINWTNIKEFHIGNSEVVKIEDSNSTVLWQKASVGPDYTEPFYVENLTTSSNTVTIKKSNSSAPTIALERSTDGTTWTNWGSTSTTGVTYSIPSKGKVYIRSKNKVSQWHGSGTYRNWINCSGNYAVGGNIMSLQYGPDFTGNERTFYDSSATYGVFMALFMNSSKLVSIEKLLMPVTTMLTYCYANMYQQCTGLTTINKDLLPATTLATYCYSNMFYNCNQITEAPDLPATSVSNYAYGAMFYYCSSLRSIKVGMLTWPSFTTAGTFGTQDWTYGLPSSGTFYKPSSLQEKKNASGNTTKGTNSITGYCNAIPYNWTIQNI